MLVATIGLILFLLPLAFSLNDGDAISAELTGMSKLTWRMYLVGQVILHDEHGNKAMICSEWFTDNNAKVICNSMGYSMGHEYHDVDLPTNRNYKVLWTLECNGNEKSIDECRRGRIVKSEECYDRKNSKAVVLACQNTNFGSVPCGLSTGIPTIGSDNEVKSNRNLVYETTDLKEQVDETSERQHEEQPVLKQMRAAFEFPWTAKLYRLQNKVWTYTCGAAVITEDMVVTLAECVEHIYHYAVTLGEFDSKSSSMFQGSYRVHSYIIHPDYDNGKDKMGSNIAVVRLMQDDNGFTIQFSPSVLPVCLPTIYANFWGTTKGVVSDWAKETLFGRPEKTRYMKAIETPFWWPYKCKEYLGENFVPGILCAGDTNGGDDACLWDEGAPLIAKLNGRATLAGLLVTTGCGNGTVPRIYIDVQHHSKWIIKTTKELAKTMQPFVIYEN